MRPIVFIVAGMALASPSAWASTELSTGAAYPAAFSDKAFAPSDRDDPALLAPGTQTGLGVLGGSPTDDDAFTVTEALLNAAPLPAKHTRFNWVFLLITFAGLTAFFAGKRSGGRGLNLV